MRNAHEELRDELMAMLAASQELPADTREHLVEAFLSRVETRRPGGRQAEILRAAYHAMVPVNLPAVLAIALAHGMALFVMGHYMLDHLMGLPTYADEYMPAWIVLGILWVGEILVTLTAISIVIRQGNRARKQRAKHTSTLKA